MKNEQERRNLNKRRNLPSIRYLFQRWSPEMMMVLERERWWSF